MRITVVDLERDSLEYNVSLTPKQMDFSGGEVTQLGPLQAEGRADLLEEHRGPRDIVQDIRVRGSYAGLFSVPCARCIDPVEQPVAGSFDLIFRPVGVDADVSEHSIGASETEIGYYEGGGLLLEDVLREQVLLALPARTLCSEDCKGLCPHCGANGNTDPCTCEPAAADPRWAALGALGSRIKANQS
jgi:uncharacterized protein